MAAIVTGCLGAVGGMVGELIISQFNYIYCFDDNITNLKKEADKLKDLERDLQGKVQAARDAVRVITHEAETWLKNSNEIKDKINGILDEVPNVGSGCFRLGARFSLSKRARETADRVKELRDQCKFNDNSIALPGHPPARKAVPSEKTYNFDSRKMIEEDIMATLRGEDVNMVGIWGMGGLGKTTMAKRIRDRALNEGVFEEVVMAVVSRNVDDSKIQLEIGGSLGLKLEGESSQGRAQKLHERLSGPKTTLVILDDVWKKLELKGLGIPYDYKGCTILLTTRDRQVMIAMDVKNIFGMKVLSEDDSWLLFRMRVGTCVDTELNSLAKKVVSECAGLPIALVTVGAALKDKSNEYAWKSALRQLERRDPNIPDFIKEVYNALEVSYNALELMYKSVFLLCCLYPEDADIPLERLNYFGMGLRIFEGGIGDVEDERNRMHTLIDVLKDRSLLLDSEEGDDYVRMHDVVRDVCIHIATKNKYISGGDSSLQRYKSDSGYGLLQIRNPTDEEINFDGIRDLYVLSIETCSLPISLPFTQRQNNLITLVLDSCWGLETLSVVGELVNLEILICRYCHLIEEVPPELKGLNRLKVLELTGCRNLQRIGRDIISSLVGLEELKMLRSFNKWEAEDREEKENAGLKEVETLSKLRSLEIEIEDLALATENIRLSSKVDRFTIRFKCESGGFESYFHKYLTKQKMCLNWDGATCLGHWIEMQLLKDTECLSLIGNGANNVDLTKLEKIRCLELGRCESMKNVVTTSMDDGGGATVFPSIDHLMLFELPKLEEIWDRRVSLNCFQILKELKLDHLPALKQLWKSNQNDVGKDFLPQLEVLEIRSCVMMEAVFLWEGDGGNENNSCYPITKSFPKLKELKLYELPNLISFCQGIEGIEFPLLRELDIKICLEMKGMVSKENNWGGSSSNASIHGLFCPQQFFCKLVSFCELKCDVEFPSLREVEIGNCPNMKNFTLGSLAAPNLESFKTDLKDYLLQVPFISPKKLTVCVNEKPLNCYQIDGSVFDRLEKLKIHKYKGSMSLFSSSITGNLVNLTTLTIVFSPKMVKVIEEKEEEKEKVVSGAQRTTILFPKLHKIELSCLPKLVRFCEWKCDVELPSLTEVEISLCRNMQSFTLGPLNTPKLERVMINRKESGGVKDLNDILQQQYINRTEEKQAEEAEKKKGGEEEQERKGETEEEQN